MEGWKKATIGVVAAMAGVGVGYVVYKTVETQKLMAEFRKLGDVNGDGKIDMKDIGIIVKTLGSTPGTANWNPNADLNGDGIVDSTDLAIAEANYGLTFQKWRTTMGYATNYLRSYTVQTAIVPIKEI
jgi:uncharacterized protein (DUF2141 family)